MVDHDRKTVTSIFEESVEARVERDIDAIMRDESYQKKFKAEKFKIEPELDKRGQIVTQEIEDFIVEKHSVLTTYTMTKFKLNIKNVEKLVNCKSFEEYLKDQKMEIIQEEQSHKMNSVPTGNKPSPFDLKDQNSSFKSQNTSRPQNNLAATAQHNNLRVEIEQGAELNPILTQGDVVEERRNRRNTSVC